MGKKREYNEDNDTKMLKLWRRAFPLMDYWPVLNEPSLDDKRLAEKYRPILYANPKLIANERAVLAYHLGIKEISLPLYSAFRERIRHRNFLHAAEALFLLCSGRFPKIITDSFPKLSKEGYKPQKLSYNLAGAELWLLSQLQSFMKAVEQKHIRIIRKPGVLKELTTLLSEVKKVHNVLNDWIRELFLKILPEETSPTCVIKYHVLHHPRDPNLCCIQYFAYWPIQTIPHHFFDYEPVYVFVRKTEKYTSEPLLIVYNATPIFKDNLKAFLSFFRKRPGHRIRTFFNYGTPSATQNDTLTKLDSKNETRFLHAPLVIGEWPEYYNHLADYMTEAYAGKYIYEKFAVSDRPKDSHINQIIKEEPHPVFYVPMLSGVQGSWHAYDLCPETVFEKTDWRIHCELHPLVCDDLNHIEWNIQNPFQVPFLYPMVGGKNPRLHYPLTLRILGTYPLYLRWLFWDQSLNRLRPLDSQPSMAKWESRDFRVGILTELLCRRLKTHRKLPSVLWRIILSNYDVVDQRTQFSEKYGKLILDG
jgi:hypothetical protein